MSQRAIVIVLGKIWTKTVLIINDVRHAYTCMLKCSFRFYFLSTVGNCNLEERYKTRFDYSQLIDHAALVEWKTLHASDTAAVLTPTSGCFLRWRIHISWHFIHTQVVRHLHLCTIKSCLKSIYINYINYINIQRYVFQRLEMYPVSPTPILTEYSCTGI